MERFLFLAGNRTLDLRIKLLVLQVIFSVGGEAFQRGLVEFF